MLALITRNSIRSLVPRLAMAASVRPMSSFGDTLEKKGKVEEDRFMRAQDAAKLEAIHKKLLEQAQAAAAASDSDQYQTHILPVMMEIKSVLANSDSLSDESLENLARWKLGL